MKELITFILLLVSFFPLSAAGNRIIDLWTMKETAKAVSTKPTYVVENSGDTISVRLFIRYISVSNQENGESLIHLDGYGNNPTPGEYSSPMRAINYPLLAENCELVVSESQYVEIPIKLPVVPEPKPDTSILSDKGSVGNSSENNPIPFCDEYSPSDFIKVSNPQYYRGIGFVPTRLSPVLYNPYRGTAKICKEISFKLIPCSDKMAKSSSKKSNPVRMDIFDDLFPKIIINDSIGYDMLQKKHSYIKEMDGEIIPQPKKPAYLILTVNRLASAAQELLKWKALLGYEVTIRNYPPSGEPRWTPDLIKKTISDFAKEHANLYYVLILGDHTQVPAEEFPHPYNGSDKFVSDFSYSCLEGEGDVTPDIYIGRIPTNTLQESKNAIEKIIAYEKNPVMDADFYNSGFNVTEFDQKPTIPGMESRMFGYTAEKIREGLTKYCGMNIKRVYSAWTSVNPLQWCNDYVNPADLQIPSELQRPNFSWDGNSNDIVESINSGCIYGLYRAHGSYTGWGSRINFNSNVIASKLSNKDKYPVIFSITCLTGAYNKSSNSFVKALLSGKEYGASGVIAATEVSYSGYNDNFSGALFRCMWPQSKISLFEIKHIKEGASEILETVYKTPINNLGKIMNFGKGVVAATYGEGYHTLLLKRLFHCFGDPSLYIKKKRPQRAPSLRVNNNGDGFEISGVTEDFTSGNLITVVDTLWNQPIAYQVLRNTFIPAINPDRCKICISGKNIKPLIINGAVGYDGRGVYRSPEIRDYVNFKTGEISPREYSSDIDKDYIINQYENGDVEVIVNGAYIFPAKRYDSIYEEKDLVWRIPGAGLLGDVGAPALPTIMFTIKRFYDPGLDELYLAECDYRDYIVEHYGAVQWPQADCIDCPEREYMPLIPYVGFRPEKQFSVTFRSGLFQDPTILHMTVVPMQYKYDTMTLRAYSRMLFKRGEPSGTATIEEDADSSVYYTIDGRPEPNPTKGGVYIRADRNGPKKVIF